MWITLAVAAIGAGFQLFSQVRQNNAVKVAGADAVANAQSQNQLAVLKSDAAYLGALSANAETDNASAEKEAKLKTQRKTLQIIGIALASVIVLALIIVFLKRK